MRTTARLVGTLVVALAMAACGGVTSPSSYPDDNFSGTLQPAGEAQKAFNVGSTGEMQMTLQSLTPTPQVGFVWMGVGQFSNSTCSPLAGYYTTQAPINQQFSFSTIPPGSYCMFVSDGSSVLKQATNFTLNTKHP
jgi:hypothetical protein